MIISTFGDSFTFGQELLDRSNAWPYQLARKLNLKVINYSNPSASNDQITRLLLTADISEITVIAWSHYARREFSDSQGIFDIWPGLQLKSLSHVNYRDELVKYITMYHNDYYDYSCYLTKIILTQSYLKANNRKYIMLDAFGNVGWQRSEHSHLIKQIDTTYYLGWPNESMMEWTYGCSQGPGGHFLEDGHKIVAEKVYEYIRNLGWIS